MSKKIDVLANVAGAQGALDRQYTQERSYNRMKGMLGGLSSIATARRNAGRASYAKQNLGLQINDVLAASDAEGLSALEKLGLQQQANKLQMMRDNIDYTNVDKLPDMYGKFFEKQPDVLKLANELRKSEIAGKYRVKASEAYGKARAQDNFGLLSAMKQFDQGQSQQNMFQNVFDSIGGLFGGEGSDLGLQYEALLEKHGDL
jgi:hypothetical protein